MHRPLRFFSPAHSFIVIMPKSRVTSRRIPHPINDAPSSTSSSSATTTRQFKFADAQAWESWLEENHAIETAAIWLEISKKGSMSDPEHTTVTYDEAVDTALCFGWIDGQRKALCDTHFLQRFSPRRKGSIWSKRNVEKITALEIAGQLREAGRTEVEAAKADGRWEKAYSSSSMMVVPEDFQTALDRNKRARDFWETLGKTKRYPFLMRIETAKRDVTRTKRIGEFVKLLASQRTL